MPILEPSNAICVAWRSGRWHLNINMYKRFQSYLQSNTAYLYRSTSHLNNHKKKHTGEKAFECPVCHARFAWKYNMQCHVRTVHEGGPSVRKNYNCLICAVKFERKLKLTQHMETVHQVDTAIVHKPVSAHDEPL